MTRKQIKQALFDHKNNVELLEALRVSRKAVFDVTYRFLPGTLTAEEGATIEAFRKLMSKLEEKTEDAVNNPAILETEVYA